MPALFVRCIFESGLRSGRLTVTADATVITTAETVIVVIGTPVDEHNNPDLFAVPDAVETLDE